jgi:hypothetical protein
MKSNHPMEKAMSRKTRVDTEARRRVLKGLAAAGGAAALAATAGRAIAAPVVEAPATPERKGYRETAHVLKYYEKAGL